MFVPSWCATSVTESPSEIGSAIRCSRQRPSSERSVQFTVAAVSVEADELDPWPFVDAAGECPAGAPEARSLPVDGSPAKGVADPDRECSSLGVVLERELPGGFDEEDVQLLPVVGGQAEPTSLDDSAGERLNVLDSEQRKGSVQKHSGHELCLTSRLCNSLRG